MNIGSMKHTTSGLHKCYNQLGFLLCTCKQICFQPVQTVSKSKALAEDVLHAFKDNKTILRFENQAIGRAQKPQLNGHSYLEFYEKDKE